MWPFDKKPRRDHQALVIIDEAIDFVAERWIFFNRSVPVSHGSVLRERIAMFARSIEKSLHMRHPALAAAPDEVMLLIIAKGVEQSGAVSRGEIERSLGILLPP